MTRDEVEAVLAHEMAHVGNGDMVTLTLIQGVVNTFVVFLSRIIANLIARNNDGSQSQGTYFLVSMVFQILFGFLASNCHVVQPTTRIPRRRGRGKTGRRTENDFRPAKA